MKIPSLPIVVSLSLLPLTQSLPTCVETVSDAGFTHPGVMHSCSDLERSQRLKSSTEEPWVSAWNAVLTNTDGVIDNDEWQMYGPVDWVLREPANQTHKWLHNDGRSAYYAAVTWFATGEQRLLDRSIHIVREWANTLVLLHDYIYGGTGMHHMSAAAEILRASPESGWGDNDTEAYTSMYATLRTTGHLAPERRAEDDWLTWGLDQDHLFGNQGVHAALGLLGLAVFSDDVVTYDRVLERATYGRSQWQVGDWAINRFINNDTDQILESGRDQPHASLFVTGIGTMARTINIQGQVGERYANLYEWGNDMPYKRGMMYWLRYNMGHDVEFEEAVTSDRGTVYAHVSPLGRGQVPGRGRGVDTFLAPPYFYYAVNGGLSDEEMAIVRQYLEFSGPAYEVAFWGDDAVNLGLGPRATEGGAYMDAIEGTAEKYKEGESFYAKLSAEATVAYASGIFGRSVSLQPTVNITARATQADATIQMRNTTSDGFVILEGVVEQSNSFTSTIFDLRGDADKTYNIMTYLTTSEELEIAEIMPLWP